VVHPAVGGINRLFCFSRYTVKCLLFNTAIFKLNHISEICFLQIVFLLVVTQCSLGDGYHHHGRSLVSTYNTITARALITCENQKTFILFTENVNILGSDDATTCIIVVLRHSGKHVNNEV
jgi:hypothetical protein